MRACERSRWGISLVCLLFAVSLCSADEKKTVAVEVAGTAECADCKTYNIKSTQAFSALRVSVDCKLENGETKRMGDADLDKDGKFKISISQEPNRNCYAQLHSAAAAAPCLSHGGLGASKIVLKSQIDGVKTFGLSTNLQFSTALCASKTFSSYFQYPPLPPLTSHPWLKSYHWPPLPPLSPHPWIKSYPPLSPHPWIKSYPPLAPFPPLTPLFHHKQPPAPVVYTPPEVEPLPPPAPVYTPTPVYHPKPPIPVYKPKPPVPVYKPAPQVKPPVPVYKPKPPVPVYKPKPPVPVYKPKPPVPIYKPAPEVKPPVPVYKPKPPVPVYKPKPPVPVYKPKPSVPVYKPRPPVPIYKPAPEVKPPVPVYNPAPEVKPLPPTTPTYKKPCPPLHKLPPLPKFPPKYFHHPKYGFNFPPLPPLHP